MPRVYKDAELAQRMNFRDAVQRGDITDATVACWIRSMAMQIMKHEGHTEWLRGFLTGVAERTGIPVEQLTPPSEERT